MQFMNTWEIDRLADTHRGHPVTGPATRFLQQFRDLIDANSDGWCHWKAPAKAADKLMTLVRNPDSATPAAFKKALTPIKSFCTWHGLTAPTPGDEETPLSRPQPIWGFVNREKRRCRFLAEGHSRGDPPVAEIMVEQSNDVYLTVLGLPTGPSLYVYHNRSAPLGDTNTGWWCFRRRYADLPDLHDLAVAVCGGHAPPEVLVDWFIERGLDHPALPPHFRREFLKAVTPDPEGEE